jgi:hypothetical protein
VRRKPLCHVTDVTAFTPPLIDTAHLHARDCQWTMDLATAVDRLETENRPLLLTCHGIRSIEEQGDGWELRTGAFRGFGPDWRCRFKGRGYWAGIRGMLGEYKGDDGTIHHSCLVMIGAAWLWRRYPLGEGRPTCGTRLLGRVADGLAADDDGAPALLGSPVDDASWHVARLDVCRDQTGHAWSPADLALFTSVAYVRGQALSSSARMAKKRAVDALWRTIVPVGPLPPDADQVDPITAAVEEDEDTGGWTWAGRNGTTLYVGRRRRESRFMRIYDKQAEQVAKGGADYYGPTWRLCLMGHADCQGPMPRIYRAEIEHGGGWLADHGLGTLDTLKPGFEWDIWADYVQKARHVEKKSERLDRCPDSIAWKALVRPWTPPPVWTYQPAPPKEPADPKFLAQMAVGCIGNWATRIAEAAGVDYETALEHVKAKLNGYLDDKAALQNAR